MILLILTENSCSVTHAFYYTMLYIGWVIGIVYLVDVFR